MGEICLFGGTAMLLAFKARLTTKDVDAIFQPVGTIHELAVFLIQHLGLKSPEEVLDLVGRYYSAERIPVKTQYLVESLFTEGKI